jgi:hypothetical protein
MVAIAVQVAAHPAHDIQLRHGIPNLANGNCAPEACTDQINHRPDFAMFGAGKFRDPQELRDAVVSDLEVNNIAFNWGGYMDRGRDRWLEDLQQLRTPGGWDYQLGDLIIPGVAFTTNKNILIFHTSPGTGNSATSVILASQLGGQADTEVPIVLAYSGSHYEGMVPVGEEDVVRTVKLVEQHRLATYNTTIWDIPVLRDQVMPDIAQAPHSSTATTQSTAGRKRTSFKLNSEPQPFIGDMPHNFTKSNQFLKMASEDDVLNFKNLHSQVNQLRQKKNEKIITNEELKELNRMQVKITRLSKKHPELPKEIIKLKAMTGQERIAKLRSKKSEKDKELVKAKDRERKTAEDNDKRNKRLDKMLELKRNYFGQTKQDIKITLSVPVPVTPKMSKQLKITEQIILLKKNIINLQMQLKCDICQDLPSIISWCGSCWNKFITTKWTGGGGPENTLDSRTVHTAFFCLHCKPLLSTCPRCGHDPHKELPPMSECTRTHDVVVNCPKCRKCRCESENCAKCVVQTPEKMFKYRINELNRMKSQLDELSSNSLNTE